MKLIEKIKLLNFKRFPALEMSLNEELNILIGDNESGKSSVLEAIELVVSGSRSKVDAIGLPNLFNRSAIEDFFAGEKTLDRLPKMYVELYINDQPTEVSHGDNNSDGRSCHGVYMICEPNDGFSEDIRTAIQQDEEHFPFEFYTVSFKYFSDQLYSPYQRFFKYTFIDNTQISNEYATRSYIKTQYHSRTDVSDRIKLEHKYRQVKEQFKTEALNDLNEGQDYEFTLKSSTKSNLESDITITEENIDLENRGKGRQCFIRTEFALNRAADDLDFVLLEEPENHLSHTWTKKLIDRIKSVEAKQVFITTHSSLISSRLNLRSCLLLNTSSTDITRLDDLDTPTAEFFMKAPYHGLLEFVLSKKVMLVEGDSEFILMEAFYKNLVGEEFHNSDIHVISVGGKSFKRYLKIAQKLGIKTAVVTDNDKDYALNITESYQDFPEDHIHIYADHDPDRYTFEVCCYEDNTAICEDLFAEGRRTLSVQQFMLQNKASCAYELLSNFGDNLVAPTYINEAIQWLRA